MKRNTQYHLVMLIYILFICSGLFSQQMKLIDYAQEISADLYWDPLTESGFFEKNGHQITFHTNDSLVILDYTKFAITDPPFIKDGILYVSRNFTEIANKLFEQESPGSFFRIGAVLIDPGHGGKDPGALDTHIINGKTVKVQEKDITLAVGKLLFNSLKTQYPEKKILMTRSDDRFLTLEERVDIANSVSLGEHEAVLYISLHVNAAFDKKASGFEVWYLSPGYRRTVISKDAAENKELLPILNSMMEEEYTTESILIAKYILDGLDYQIGKQIPNRGIKQEEWFVVRNANMPSVLVELGFITNTSEVALLINEEYLQKVNLGIYNGLTAFISHFEKSRGFTGL